VKAGKNPLSAQVEEEKKPPNNLEKILGDQG
jgi:hypothetical protein